MIRSSSSKRYNNASAFRVVQSGRDLFQNTDIQENKDLIPHGFRYNKFDVFVYGLMKRSVSGRAHR